MCYNEVCHFYHYSTNIEVHIYLSHSLLHKHTHLSLSLFPPLSLSLPLLSERVYNIVVHIKSACYLFGKENVLQSTVLNY